MSAAATFAAGSAERVLDLHVMAVEVRRVHDSFGVED
jgi:hypothetical protein